MLKLISISLLGLALFGCSNDSKDKKDEPTAVTPSVLPPSPDTGPVKTFTPVTLGELSCLDAGGYITGCKFTEKTLAAKQGTMTRFTLNYDFNCQGDRLPIIVDFDGVEIPLKQEAGKTLVLYGFGPFVVKDADPDLTAEGSLQPGCELNFSKFKTETI